MGGRNNSDYFRTLQNDVLMTILSDLQRTLAASRRRREAKDRNVQLQNEALRLAIKRERDGVRERGGNGEVKR